MTTPSSHEHASLIGASASMQQVVAYATKAAATETSVLITGETGTGKERIARLIHESSPRRNRPMVSINCAALPDALIESELFGYERGAFTGAVNAYPGKLKLADGGTLFLDEISDMSLQAQAKLLRALESREAYRLGGRHCVGFDVRVVAATNADPQPLVDSARFRKDLYFRISVARIHLPPLRERQVDIVPLFDHYVAEMNRRYGLSVRGVSREALVCLLRYDWPGNIRELRNLVEAIFIDPPQREIGLDNLPSHLRHIVEERREGGAGDRERLLEALTSTRWNVTRAAKVLHWSRMTVYRKIAKYQLVRTRRRRGDMPHQTR